MELILQAGFDFYLMYLLITILGKTKNEKAGELSCQPHQELINNTV